MVLNRPTVSPNSVELRQTVVKEIVRFKFTIFIPHKNKKGRSLTKGSLRELRERTGTYCTTFLKLSKIEVLVLTHVNFYRETLN